MASLTHIREALAANLSTIDGIQVNAYLLSNVTPPCIEVQPGEIQYDLLFQRGLDQWSFTVRLLVSSSIDAGSQRFADKLLESSGTLSVKAALEADKTLGGACSDLRVERCTGYVQSSREGSGPLLGAEWTVTVYGIG